MDTSFDIVVVGGGHAGCEAAAAAARLGRRVALVNLSANRIARLSCNPAVGGLAKGHLVRELDALGGLMGRVADRACLQFRHLNTRKGLAVRSSRAQVDIAKYPLFMQSALGAIDGLHIIEGEVAGLRVGERVQGVDLADGTRLVAPAVILTTGTFLGGVLHRGEHQVPGGREGEGATHGLSRSLSQLGLRLGRLKTGTTPRLDGRTIDWDAVELQGDTVPQGRFSFGPVVQSLGSIDVYMTYTNPKTHDLVREAMHRSPLTTGAVTGAGPRYCPSIEDKLMRFADKERHLIFLEPEGLGTHRVYPAGITTSLPVEVQLPMMRSIVGLEQVEIMQPGYAVEYDYVDPTQLGHDLQHRTIPGLYLAGQVNGTSGYEEAAVQGFVAGVSAAQGEALRLGRDAAYIGVLIDDLVSRGVGGEPYRMFTSRAEHRLLLREDNADRRLMPLGRELGLIDDATWGLYETKAAAIERTAELVAHTTVTPRAEVLTGLERAGLGGLRRPSKVEELLRRPQVEYGALARVLGLPEVSPEVAEQVTVDVKYAGYIRQAQARANSAAMQDRVPIPREIDWLGVDVLTPEVRERLHAARPETLGQVSRLPGVTPAAVGVVAALLQRRRAG